MKRSLFFNILMIALFILIAFNVFSEDYYNHENEIAIKGYDPVAYFTQQKAVKGSAFYSYHWDGVTWYFASIEHRDLFKANPQEYVPQYGGYCAWAMSRGYFAGVDPKVWYIYNEKLYLNYNEGIGKKWEKDIPGSIEKGDAQWKRLAPNLQK